MEDFWNRTYDFITTLREGFKVPLWIEPVQFRRIPVLPLIDGVILNSPAMAAGIQPGDEVIAINGSGVHARSEIRDMFNCTEIESQTGMEVKIRRKGREMTIDLDRVPPGSNGFSYPYDPCLHHPGERAGMLFLPDFDPRYLAHIAYVIQKHNAEKVLFFCSPLTAGVVETLVRHQSFYEEFFEHRALWLYVPGFNTMEGNTHLMESRFVEDYETAFLRACDEIRDRPDLILVPDAFGSSWGVDFHGRSIFELQYVTGIPVELVPLQYVYGRED
ncbi:MAG: PDZ domain-containing protein [Deltaproteobacteria bacterium]|nr:PDZ domain-containing protein [Deltaproteobacteria bacterium]